MLTQHEGDKGGDVQTPPKPAVLFPVLSSRRPWGVGSHLTFRDSSDYPSSQPWPGPCPFFCILLPLALKTHIPTQMINRHHSWGHMGSLAGYDVTLHCCLLCPGCSPPSVAITTVLQGCHGQMSPTLSLPWLPNVLWGKQGVQLVRRRASAHQ
ncbi:hypothetical protein HJG60_010265 [Phyllostomus discolor]|uniref:Uncharacterized protein n=1 Tax=Phyllostomus discolor TaxID=89673 RepID=A0A834AY24_9CHIR|nr:hypothetical protein HJG60_010265 [Phyllostomus discolor]